MRNVSTQQAAKTHEPAGPGVSISPRPDEGGKRALTRRGSGFAMDLRHAQPSRLAPGRASDAGLAICMALLAASLALPALASATEDGGRLFSPSPISADPSASAIVSHPAQSVPASHPRRANLGRETASPEAAHVADWVVDSGDNQGMPFIIVDKVHAQVMLFDAGGRLQGAAPALLGLARGDDSTPGIGERKMSSIRPDERTTPAGRFVASLDRDAHGQEFLWVDYSTAISLHRIVTGKSGEKRAQRLDSATAADNRISYGCINVPVSFYERVVSPAFARTSGIVYVLPETRSAREVFGSYDVEDQQRDADRPASASIIQNSRAVVR